MVPFPYPLGQGQEISFPLLKKMIIHATLFPLAVVMSEINKSC
jgi:hypothetical protein